MRNLFLMSISVLFLYSFSTPKKYLNTNKEKALLTDSIPVFLKGYTYKNIDGTQFSFQQVKGKVLLLDFWATWCGPCIRAHPDMVALEKKINNSNFKIITISVDKDISKWKTFIAQHTWKGIQINTDITNTEDPLAKMVIKKIIHHNKTLLKTSVPRYFLIDTNLSIKKIKDITSPKTVTQIQKKLHSTTFKRF